MAKQNKDQTKGGAAAEQAKVPTIHIVPEAKANFRQGSARAEYYKVFVAHDGKPLDTALKAIEANVPSTPKKGKLAGKPEPVQGWVRWFIRNGYMQVTES